MAEATAAGPGREGGEQEDTPPAAKRRRLQGGGAERFVPPPRKLNPGVSFSEAHFAETSYYFEGGLRKVRPYYFDFQTYCKGRWVGKSLLHVFASEFRAHPLAYYRVAARAGRLRLNEQPVRDLDVVLKVRGQQRGLESKRAAGLGPRVSRGAGKARGGQLILAARGGGHGSTWGVRIL